MMVVVVVVVVVVLISRATAALLQHHHHLESVDINTVSPDTGMSAAHYCVLDGGDRDVMEWLHKEVV